MLEKNCIMSNVCSIKCTLNWGLQKQNIAILSINKEIVGYTRMCYIMGTLCWGYTICFYSNFYFNYVHYDSVSSFQTQNIQKSFFVIL